MFLAIFLSVFFCNNDNKNKPILWLPDRNNILKIQNSERLIKNFSKG